ncbi:hypothetical protein D3C81_680280 [compost metagenome]
MPTRGDQVEDQRTGSSDGADRNAQRLDGEEADQQQCKHPPAGHERRPVADSDFGSLQLVEFIGTRQVLAEEPQQHSQGGGDADQVHRHHDRGVLAEANAKVVGGNDVHQVGHHQRQARGIGDEARRHDECQRRRRGEAQGQQHGDDDRGQDQCRTVVSEQRRDSGAQQDDEGEQLAAAAITPAGHVQCRPLEEPRLIQQQADDDDGDESGGSVPDDLPDHGNIGQAHDARQQRHDGPQCGAPAHAQAFGLPDDENDRHQENQKCDQHDYNSISEGKSQAQATGLCGRSPISARRNASGLNHSWLASTTPFSIASTHCGSSGCSR